MKAIANDAGKGSCHDIEGETNEEVQELTEDPTLEGRDENTVGRVEPKVGAGLRKPSNNEVTSC
jgi:hypothetical protein